MNNLIIRKLESNFVKEFEAALVPFSKNEQLEIIETMLQAACKFQNKEDFETVFAETIQILLNKHRSRMAAFVQNKISDYLLKDSTHVVDVQIDGGADYAVNMTDQEYETYLTNLIRYLKNCQLHTLVFASEDVNVNADTEEDSIQGLHSKEFTTRKRALALHYLNKAFRISSTGDIKPLAIFANFLTGNSLNNLYKILLDPLNASEAESSKKTLRNDLEFVKKQFENLGLVDIVRTIQEDIKTI